MTALLPMALLVPLVTACLALIGRSDRRLQRQLGVLGAGALLAVSLLLVWQVRVHGVLVHEVGAWPGPYGIVLVADVFAAIMVLMAGLIGFSAAVYSLVSVDADRETHGYYPLMHILLMGVCGAFLTGDLFNLFVWFEVLLISSFVLLALGSERGQMEGAMKYVVINLLSSAIFLTAVGLLYSVTGTLNMADMAVKLPQVPNQGLVTACAMLLMVAFGIKAAVFPLFFWLPASYHTPPVAVAALFAGLLTKVGVYALIRVFTLLFTGDVGYTHAIILVVAGLTMITGVLGAVAQNEIRRILSFHIISQIGYMIMGLGLYTPLALAGSVFYIAHHIIVKTNLFFVGGIVHHLRGSYHLQQVGGLYRSRPLLAVLFLIPALSLAGLPPLSGFWAKLTLVRAALEAGSWLIVGMALLVGMLTLFSMSKIWNHAFWKADPAGRDGAGDEPSTGAGWLAPVLLLAGLTVFIGLWAQPLFALSLQAADQLMDPSVYVEAVLGGRG